MNILCFHHNSPCIYLILLTPDSTIKSISISFKSSNVISVIFRVAIHVKPDVEQKCAEQDCAYYSLWNRG